MFFAFTASAFAGVTINSPSNGETVSSPFTLSASASTCSSQTVSAMGYSLDSASDTTIVHETALDAQVAAGTGSHTVHVKAWGNNGAVCVTDVAVTVLTGSTVQNSTGIPSDATSVSSLQTLSGWKAVHDSGTPGSSNGKMSITGSPSLSGEARALVTTYTSGGGERYELSFGDDASATNFLYDAWVYLTSSSSHIANLEMDLNQVMPNGQTAIFGFQCDGYSGTWDYTVNAGTPKYPKDHWLHSNAACNVRSWSTNAWHHVQISYSRTDTGQVTYRAVWLDGVEQDVNATVSSAFALGWGPSLLTQVQVDGLGSSGSATVYVDDLTIYRW